MNLEKMHKYDIVLLGGLYGSGKTVFGKVHFKSTGRLRVSRSELRKLLFEMTNFGIPWTSDQFRESDDYLVKHVERRIIEHHLHAKNKVLIVNTFVTMKSRMPLIQFAKDTKRTIGMIFLSPPIADCIENNKKNSSPVPLQVLNALNNKMELPSIKEGFNEVIIIKEPLGGSAPDE